MTMRSLFWGTAAGLAGLMATTIGMAATSPNASAPAPQPIDPGIYRPVTSDLMNAVIQPRHIKLWLAGKAGNWVFADYERHNIGGALARMAKAIPMYKDTSNTDLIAAFATPQLAALDTAIKHKDEAAFQRAYGDLTAGCNGCHQTTGHEMVAIKVPDGNAFPDQDFQPPAQ
ncbi:MAG: hypothetical protein P4L71_02355 [Acetobacteraceae bacterium]|nr:hypothetical protein [Acetobacteraceae bacterium]